MTLKIIWSAGTIVGIGWCLAESAPPLGWGLLVIFAAFHVLWVRSGQWLRPRLNP